jgi:hypothetical protein
MSMGARADGNLEARQIVSFAINQDRTSFGRHPLGLATPQLALRRCTSVGPGAGAGRLGAGQPSGWGQDVAFQVGALLAGVSPRGRLQLLTSRLTAQILGPFLGIQLEEGNLRLDVS